MRVTLRLVAVLTTGLIALSACGSSDDQSGEDAIVGTLSCDGTPLNSSEIELPADFPIPSEAVLTSADVVGPSSITEGFFDGDLEAAYGEWKAAIEEAEYDVLFDEIEERDSEISYASADGKSTGQIALRSECKDAGKTFVHITNRPA
jgi:hypothetical protein